MAFHAWIAGEHRSHAARGVLAEHQVLGIQPREGLFVLALHPRSAPSSPAPLPAHPPARDQRQLVELQLQFHPYLRGGCCACGVAQPGRDRKRSQSRTTPTDSGRGGVKSSAKPFGVRLPRQRGGRGTRAGVFDLNASAMRNARSAKLRCPPDSASSRNSRFPARRVAAKARRNGCAAAYA